MTTSTAEFDELQSELTQGGVGAVLERLAQQLTAQKKYHELYEARKMQARHRLGLPLRSADGNDSYDEETEKKLMDALLDACREVGTLLLRSGKVREAWMYYLRAVGDRESVARELENIEVDDENLDEVVEVALHEGVSPKLGFGLVLEHYGTCNAITTFESSMYQRSKSERQATGAMLVRHLHDELSATVRADIAQQQGSEPTEKTLRELVTDRDWLFGENSYHVDTTHLAAAVRAGRLLDEEEGLRLAFDLTEYGRRLSAQFQYQGDEPFADMYPSHALFFQALLGENIEEALSYFREKAESLDVAEHGTAAIETYLDLLSRTGRYEQAVAEAMRLIPEEMRSLGSAPMLLELSQKAGAYASLLDFCKEHNDLLGFATTLVHSELDKG